MTDPIIIDRADLLEIVRDIATSATRTAIDATLKEKGIRIKVSSWISQNRASKIIGRDTVHAGIITGWLRFRIRNENKKIPRIDIWKEDVLKYQTKQI